MEASLNSQELEVLYGGVLSGRHGIGGQLASGTLTEDQFRTLFDVFDEQQQDMPSLGVFVTIRATHLLLMGELANWCRAVVVLVNANRELREKFAALLAPDAPYDQATAREALDAEPEVQTLIIRGMLMWLGFHRARHWVKVTDRYLRQVGHEAFIIVQHLREASLREIRYFMGAEADYDPTELYRASERHRSGCAQICAARAPELFLYHCHRLGLDTKSLVILCLIVRDIGAYQLSAAQRRELLAAEWLPQQTRHDFANVWRM